MLTTNPSTPKCEECGDSGAVNKIIGSGQPGTIGSHIEMQACTACTIKDVVQTPDLDPALYHEKNYVSPDGRTPVDHYMRGGVECVDVMRAVSTPEGFQAHCHLTAFKYLYRLGEKDDPIHEVKKARDYLMWLQQSLEAEAAKKPQRSVAQRIQDGLDRLSEERPESD